MGLFDVFSPAKRAAKAAAEAAVVALTAEMRAALPVDAQITADSWSVGFTTYTVAVTGTADSAIRSSRHRCGPAR